MTSSVSRFVSAPATTALAPALCSDCAMSFAELTSSTYHLLAAHLDAKALTRARVALALLGKPIKAFLT